MVGTALKCNREAESHEGPLRKDGDGYVCWQCWALENDVPIKKSLGRQFLCPECGKELMSRFRSGAVSLTSASMRGNKTILKCDCGYEKVIPNAFGSSKDRNQLARQPLIHAAAKTRLAARKKRDRNHEAELAAEPSDVTDEASVFKGPYFHDGKGWVPLTAQSLPQYLAILEELNGTAD